MYSIKKFPFNLSAINLQFWFIILIFDEDFLTFDAHYLETRTELKGYLKKISLVMLREVTKHRVIVFQYK